MVAGPVFADGKVFSAESYSPHVEIPDQQALIHFAGGKEQLVIETSFAGQGTNFAWIVPLPAPPEVAPVDRNLFSQLRQAFQPRLVHDVPRLYVGILFFALWAWLAWRSLSETGSWRIDLPVCLATAVAVGLYVGNAWPAAFVLMALLYVRAFTRNPPGFGAGLLAGLVAAGLVVMRKPPYSDMVSTMGAALGGTETVAVRGVTVLARQQAGVFDTATLQSTNAQAVTEWLRRNGFHAPASIGPGLEHYVRRGWVFVAAKVQRTERRDRVSSLHPLLFRFPTATPVYPLRLTGVDNGVCAIDLYVFGERRAKAPHFKAVRCDRWVASHDANDRASGTSRLWLPDGEVRQIVGPASVGTKLSGRLAPQHMMADAEIAWRTFSRTGATVYSPSGAATMALNLAAVAIALGLLAVSACRGGWGLDDARLARWRWRAVLASLLAGLVLFLLLPKTEVEVVTVPDPWGESE
jgi:hypothetical protein